ncbi:MAG TPA: hypothetical protein VFW95_11700 [Candidatus Limnocylindria bacterium]|nr:hypothetical protein [Candidatus Limnocylindria bacterium]
MRSVAGRSVAFWALAGVALLVSHDAVFAIQAGPGQRLTEALRAAGHDYWGVASAFIAAIGLVVGLVAVARLRRLQRHASDLRAAPRVSGRTRQVLRTWGRLFVIVTAGFLVQENLEHLAMHGHLIGAGALAGPEYPLALPVIAAVTFVAGVVGGLIRGKESALLQAIAAALAGLDHGPVHVIRRPGGVRITRASILARCGAGRAPPRVAVLI